MATVLFWNLLTVTTMFDLIWQYSGKPHPPHTLADILFLSKMWNQSQRKTKTRICHSTLCGLVSVNCVDSIEIQHMCVHCVCVCVQS